MLERTRVLMRDRRPASEPVWGLPITDLDICHEGNIEDDRDLPTVCDGTRG